MVMVIRDLVVVIMVIEDVMMIIELKDMVMPMIGPIDAVTVIWLDVIKMVIVTKAVVMVVAFRVVMAGARKVVRNTDLLLSRKRERSRLT